MHGKYVFSFLFRSTAPARAGQATGAEAPQHDCNAQDFSKNV